MRAAVFFACTFLTFSSPALAADIFESQTAGYSLIYSDDWQVDANGTSGDTIALKCALPICEGTVRASVDIGYDYRYANDKPADLFRRMYPNGFTKMVEQSSLAIGRAKELVPPSRQRIGNTEGFVGTFQLNYHDGRMRHMIYGIILNNGYIYHIKFLSADVPNQNIKPIADAFFDGFQVNEEVEVIPTQTTPDVPAPVTDKVSE